MGVVPRFGARIDGVRRGWDDPPEDGVHVAAGEVVVAGVGRVGHQSAAFGSLVARGTFGPCGPFPFFGTSWYTRPRDRPVAFITRVAPSLGSISRTAASSLA